MTWLFELAAWIFVGAADVASSDPKASWWTWLIAALSMIAVVGLAALLVHYGGFLDMRRWF